MTPGAIAGGVGGIVALLGLVVGPTLVYLEEKRHFRQLSIVRTIAVVQVWITLAFLEAVRLFSMKQFFGSNVRMQAHRACGRISGLLFRTFFDKYEIEGTEKLPKGSEPFIIVANHQSMMDVAAIFALRLKAAWVAKTAVFVIPGVGWLMWLAEYIPVKRKNKDSIKKMYAACKVAVKDGWSLIIFPQGTRNRQTTLPFKDGAFNLAAELGVPILPVSIVISDDLWLNGSRVKIVVHDLVKDTSDKEKTKNACFKTIMAATEYAK